MTAGACVRTAEQPYSQTASASNAKKKEEANERPELDDLAKLLQSATKAPCPISFWSEAYDGPTGYGALFGGAILAAGYRKSRTIKRTIRTHQERAALKPGTICMDLAGNAWKRGTGSWVGTGEGGALYDEENLTMIILHEPDDTK